MKMKAELACFRPLTGIKASLTLTRAWSQFCAPLCFRPLTGIKASLTINDDVAKLNEWNEFPTPYGD